MKNQVEKKITINVKDFWEKSFSDNTVIESWKDSWQTAVAW